MTRFSPTATALTFIFTLSLHGRARALPPEVPTELEQATTRGSLDPTNASSLAQQSAIVSVESTNKDKRIGARIGVRDGDDAVFDARLNVPLDEDATEFELATLDGLANQANLDVGASFRSWEPSVDKRARQKACDDQWAINAAEYDKLDCIEDNLSTTDAKKSWQAAAVADRASVCKANFEAQKKAYLQERADARECARYLITSADVLTKYDDAVNFGTPLFVGARVKLARKKFHFVNDQFVEQEPESHISWAAVAHGGAYLESLGYAGVSARIERSWKADDSAEYCAPVGTGGVTKCQKLEDAAPSRKTKVVASVEWRRYFGAHVGIGLTAAYDLVGQVLGAELPLYFLQSPDGGLNGGLKVGLSSEDATPSLSLFVGSTFSPTP